MDKNLEARKQKLAYFWAIVTIIAVIIIGAGVVVQSNIVLPIFLAVLAICFGPICAVLYIMEIKRGVLSVDDTEE